MRLLSLTLLLALGVGTKAETTQKDSIQTIKGVETCNDSIVSL